MKNVLVLGSGGMAGHVVSLFLQENDFEVSTLSAHNTLDKNTVLLDVTQKIELEDYLSSNSFDVVINCIGLLVKQSEEKKDLAVYLNAYLPHYLESFYKKSNTKLIHLSTDCVFSGKKAPYSEDSQYDGESFYDRSKALGEVINDKDLTFRMSIVGPDMQENGEGLFNWFFKQNGEISGYSKTIWNGITTIELAKGIEAAINQDLTGLYHLTPTENISKYELLELFKKEFNRNDIIIKANDEIISDKTLINSRTDFDYVVSDYPRMISEMHKWIDSHKEQYKHYEK